MFRQTAREVVDNSIQKVFCLDDDYVEPYSTSDGNLEISKEMYNELTNSGKLVSLKKYDESFNSSTHDFDYDLVILDWQLTNDSSKYKETLKIINQLVNSQMRFISIYTDGNLEEVLIQVAAYFNIVTKSNKEELFEDYEDFCEAFSDDEELLEEIKAYYFSGKDKEEIRKKVFTNSNIRKAFCDLHKVAKDRISTTLSKEDLIDIIGVISYATDLPSVNNEDIKISILEGEKEVFKLGNSIITLMKKENGSSGEEGTVRPENIISKIGEYISKTPNQYMSIVWLELMTKFSKESKTLMSGYRNVDEKLFIHYLNEHGEDSVNNVLIDETAHLLVNDFDLKTIKDKDKYVEQNGIVINEDDLAARPNEFHRFNSLLTLNHSDKVFENRRIQFGDILYKVVENNKQYFLCITPHCDCAEPSKVKNNYTFVKGQNIKNEVTYTEPDTGFFSYINLGSEILPIEWGNKIQMIKFESIISDREIIGSNLEGDREKYFLVSNQKENFTQRVANESTNYTNRVGVSLLSAKIKS